MKIIGISGLENSVPFKLATWPGLEERGYRIAQGMDSAAALLADGQLIGAAEQERFSGKKHTGAFPIDSIQFCLAQAGLKIQDIDEIAHGFDYARIKISSWRTRSRPTCTVRYSRKAHCYDKCDETFPGFRTRRSFPSVTTWPMPQAPLILRVGTNA